MPCLCPAFTADFSPRHMIAKSQGRPTWDAHPMGKMKVSGKIMDLLGNSSLLWIQYHTSVLNMGKNLGMGIHRILEGFNLTSFLATGLQGPLISSTSLSEEGKPSFHLMFQRHQKRKSNYIDP